MDMEALDAEEERVNTEQDGQPGGGSQAATRTWTEAEWDEWNRSWWPGWQWWGRNGQQHQGSNFYNGAAGSAEQSGGATQQVGHSAEEAVAVEPTRDSGHPDDWWQRDYAGQRATWHEPAKWWSSGKQPQQKGDFANPPTWGGWSNYRIWKRAVSRWGRNTDVPAWRRAEKLLMSFDWDMQSKLDHLPEEVLSSPRYLDEVLSVLDVMAGEKESSDRRRCIRAALYEGNRRQDESLSQYSLRRESQFIGASKYIQIPDELKAFMLEEQSGLTHQGIQNLRALTGGRHQYAEVQRALKLLDIEEESMFKSDGKSSYLAEAEDLHPGTGQAGSYY